jgi:eukaryotic-like serine/threonine-protein kinase
MDLTPGSVIAGRYRADRRVGAGGMGEVWAGEHLAIGVKVAIKTLLPAAKVSHEVVARFKREAFLLGRIRSEYVARVLDFVNDDEFGLVIVMEYVEGDSLAKQLSMKRLTVEEGVDLGADVASALCDLHRVHVVHRDLKPGNIILSPVPGGRKRAVVVDFGVSRMVSGSDDEEETITGITRANMAVGTVEYMAPEQILNSRDVTGGSDLYALGAILYRAVTGHHAYGEVYENELAHTKLTKDAPPLETGRSDRVARGLESVVARALKRRLNERYVKAEEMLAELSILRDLARMAELDIADSTTTTLDAGPSELMRDAPPSAPSGPSGPISAPTSRPSNESSGPAPPTTMPSDPSLALHRSSISAGGQSVPMSPPAPRRGASRSLVAVAVLSALVCGGAVGVLVTQRAGMGTAEATASVPTVEATAVSAAEAPPAPEPTEAVEPAPSATASGEIDLGELEPPPPPRAARPRPSGAPTSTGMWIPPITSAGTVAQPTSPGSAKPGAPPPPKVSPPPVEKIVF